MVDFFLAQNSANVHENDAIFMKMEWICKNGVPTEVVQKQCKKAQKLVEKCSAQSKFKMYHSKIRRVIFLYHRVAEVVFF